MPVHAHRRRSSARSSLYGDVRDLWSTATLSTANLSVSDFCEDYEDESARAVGKPRRYSQTISMTETLKLKPEEIQQQARLELELHRGRTLQHDLTEEEEESASDVGQCSLAEAMGVPQGWG